MAFRSALFSQGFIECGKIGPCRFRGRGPFALSLAIMRARSTPREGPANVTHCTVQAQLRNAVHGWSVRWAYPRRSQVRSLGTVQVGGTLGNAQGARSSVLKIWGSMDLGTA